MKDKFIAFLTENDALEAFKDNVKAEKNESIDVFLDREHREPISEAFIWSRTPEGIDYWSNLNDKWFNELESEEK